ncbi:hypothetical protein AX17_003297 [Amanita inopinata Kibby_2008]|nr:hypothetical protein AX17_003297 [Amanita inopinata Kibby_2008]
MPVLKILHWNDVYKVGPHKLSPDSAGTIDVTQFDALVKDIRAQWPTLPGGGKDGLFLFSGDVFSPSVESTVTRGSHMVPVMNELAPDVALTGNHDFDFGFPHLTKLVQDCHFPWILSNIIDADTLHVPQHLHEFKIFERAGLRIGVIGLVEEDWIATVASWPTNFVFKDMYHAGMNLSRRLRDPEGEYKCDIIIALTHSRLPTDIALAKKLLALSSSAQEKHAIANEHGVDIILGGHDHLYFASKGVDDWEGYNFHDSVLGAEGDIGDVLVVKSGYDFRDLSELTISVQPTPPGSIRSHVVKQVSGKRYFTTPEYKSSQPMRVLLDALVGSVSSTLKAPVCRITTLIDLRSQHIRTEESAGANWFADILRHAYDDALCMHGCGGTDGVLICAGTLRGDSMYGAGYLTLGDILEILPFEDPVVVLEIDGETLWNALEASLELWPAQEGRFPVISGLRVSWDSRRQPGERVLGIWLVAEQEESDDGQEVEGEAPIHHLVDTEPVRREKGGRMYKIVTRDYMAEGHDGFVALKDKRYLIDHEAGSLMSSLVRKYLLGSQFVTKMTRISDHANGTNFQDGTWREILRARAKKQALRTLVHNAVQQWKGFVRDKRSKTHFKNQFNICTTEHMSSVDAFDGETARKGQTTNIKRETIDDDLLIVTPVVDGRLRDEGRQ